MVLEFFKRLVANLFSKPATTLTGLLAGLAIILAQGEVVVPVDWKEAVTVIAGIIEAVTLIFTKKVGLAVTQAKSIVAMSPSGDGNGAR